MSRPTTNKRLIYHPMNEKIYTGLTQADILTHHLDLTDLLPSNVVEMYVGVLRTSGTGIINVYPISGTHYLNVSAYIEAGKQCGIINQKLKYALTVINDVFDVYCLGCKRELSMMQRDVR